MPRTPRTLSPTAYRKELAALSEGFRRAIEQDCSGFSDDQATAAARKGAAVVSLESFSRTYFPHFVDRPASTFHKWFFRRMEEANQCPTGNKIAIAAPRGEAKTTLGQLFVLWCVVTRRKRLIAIFSDSGEQAEMILAGIKAELEHNPRLKTDFPEAAGQGRVWQEGIAITANDVKIQAFGAGKRMRGLRHGPYRPDLVILDDIENDLNVQARKQRDRLVDWLSKAVLQLGPADDSMDVLYLGTILHHDSALARTIKNRGWDGHRFQAIIDWPDRMDMWDRWEEIFHALGPGEARAHFEQNRATMTAGAKVSWPEVRPLETLMMIRARDGRQAFDAELQNAPSSESGTFQEITFWTDTPPGLPTFAALDPSLGKAGRNGDPCAILVGAFDRKAGILYVVEADIQRRTPDKIIEDAIRHQKQHAISGWSVESVQFQDFFREELIRRSVRAGAPIAAYPIQPTVAKEIRIASLQPFLAAGLIQLHRGQKTLIHQLAHFDEGDTNDDGPDALEMLWRIATQRGQGIGKILSVGGSWARLEEGLFGFLGR